MQLKEATPPPEQDKQKPATMDVEDPVKAPGCCRGISFPSNLLQASLRQEIKKLFFSLVQALI